MRSPTLSSFTLLYFLAEIRGNQINLVFNSVAQSTVSARYHHGSLIVVLGNVSSTPYKEGTCEHFCHLISVGVVWALLPPFTISDTDHSCVGQY